MQVTGEPLIKRSDDNETTLMKRLKTYHSVTLPLVDYYKQKGVYSYVNAAMNADTVFTTIRNIFEHSKRSQRTASL